MQVGIVGLPYSGKTTFFQTLTEIQIDESTAHKKETNQAIVKVKDKRLDKLAEIFNPKRKIYATLEIVDTIGIQKSEAEKNVFPPQLLAKIKTNDALIQVVRGFENDTYPHPLGSIDLIRDIKLFQDELIFNDLLFIENRLEKLEKDIQKLKVKDQALKEKETFLKWNEHIQQNKPLRELEFTAEEIKYIKIYQLLTAKPLLIALNLDEKDISQKDKILNKVLNEINWKNVIIEPFFAKIELELSQLSDDEKIFYMKEYQIEESALERLIKNAYKLLGLQSFFTVGEDECRAWTIKKGMNAQESAGVIHTDFYNKFIRAEVVAYEDFIKYGSFAKCKEHGVFRLEGKDYILRDGDIMHIRHN